MKPTLKVEYREQTFNEENNSLEETYKHCKCAISWEDYLKNKWVWLILSVLFMLAVTSLFVISINFWSHGATVFIGMLGIPMFYVMCYIFNVLCDQFEYVDMWGICGRRELSKHERFLIDKYFPKLEEEFNTNSIIAVIKATQWRAQHSLEEKCRLAMTKNPNYVADLIKYVKENNQHDS